MKKLLFLPLVLAFIACTSKPDCNYSKVEIKLFVNNQPKDSKELEGCFSVSEPDEMGLVQVTDKDERIKVSYFKESDPVNLKILNIKFGQGDPVEWRAKKGHQLIIINKKDTLGFMFWDKNSVAGRISGTILYIK